MAFLGSHYAIGDSLLIPYQTTDADRLPADATGNPAYQIYEQGGTVVVTSGSFAKRDDANTLGYYEVVVSLLTATGFEQGKTYTVRKTATVSGAGYVELDTFAITGGGALTSAVANVSDALRELLGDPDGDVYSDDRLTEALRLNRETILYRDPTTSSIGLAATAWRTAAVRVPHSDTDYSLLIAEPDGLSYQCLPAVRYWDNTVSAAIWVDGELQTTGYTVNYLSGRVTFSTALEDYQAVNASFSYYKLLHAARQCILTRKITDSDTGVSLKQGPVTIQYGTVADAIRAIDAMLREQQPKTLPIARRIY